MEHRCTPLEEHVRVSDPDFVQHPQAVIVMKWLRTFYQTDGTPRVMVIHGPAGCGKRYTLHTLLRVLEYNHTTVSAAMVCINRKVCHEQLALPVLQPVHSISANGALCMPRQCVIVTHAWSLFHDSQHPCEGVLRNVAKYAKHPVVFLMNEPPPKSKWSLVAQCAFGPPTERMVRHLLRDHPTVVPGALERCNANLHTLVQHIKSGTLEHMQPTLLPDTHQSMLHLAHRAMVDVPNTYYTEPCEEAWWSEWSDTCKALQNNMATCDTQWQRVWDERQWRWLSTSFVPRDDAHTMGLLCDIAEARSVHNLLPRSGTNTTLNMYQRPMLWMLTSCDRATNVSMGEIFTKLP